MDNLPFDFAAAYEGCGSIREVAKQYGVSQATVKKHLITSGEYTTDTADAIADLLEQGFAPAEITAKLQISRSAYHANVPYTKGTYLSQVKTPNALRIQKCRKKLKD